VNERRELLLKGKDELSNYIDSNRKNGWPDLKPNEKTFAFNYMQHFNHNRAARDAGWKSAGYGLKLLRDPLVSAFIGFLKDELQERTLIDAEFVQSQWLELLPKLNGEEDIPLITSSGEEIMARKFHGSEMVSALRELGKSTKFYEEGSGGSGNVSIAINLAALGIDENNNNVGITIEGEVGK